MQQQWHSVMVMIMMTMMMTPKGRRLMSRSVSEYQLHIRILWEAFFKKYIYWLCYYSCPIHPSLLPSALKPPPTSSPPLSSCPYIIHISSLASPFSILFLTSPCLFSTCHLCYLFSVPFPLLSPTHTAADNPPCGLHFWDSVLVLVICLVCFGCCWVFF